MSATVDYAKLSAPELLDLLFSEEDRLPRAAVDEIVKRGDAFAGRLKQIVRDVQTIDAAGREYWAVLHAVHLLGLIRPAGSLEALMECLHLAGETEDDWLLESLPKVLGAFGPAAVDALENMARHPHECVCARAEAITALHIIALDHPESRTRVVPILRDIAAETADEDYSPSIAAIALLDFAEARDRELLHAKAVQQVLTDEDVEAALAGSPPRWGKPMRDWLGFYDADEIAKRQKEWAEQEAVGREEEPRPDDEDDAYYDDDPPPPPLRRDQKIGRNDPCPCGSGKKYKKCCGK